MFEAWIGRDRWRHFIRAYITHHEWKNATADDFIAVMEASLGAEVAAAFRTFLDRPGLPVIEHRLICEGGAARLELSQRRSLPAGVTDDAAAHTWHLPVCLRYGAGRTVHRGCVLMNAPTTTVPLEGRCPTWVVMNADADGYYRSRYAASELPALLGRRSPLTMPERSMLLADITGALVRDELRLEDTLPLAAAIIADPDDRLRARVWSVTGPLRRDALDPALQPRYRRWVKKVVAPLARQLGWRRRPKDTDDRHALRVALVPIAAWAGDTRLVKEASDLAIAWLDDPKALEDDTVSAVLATAARAGNALLFDRILDATRATQDRTRQQRLIYALGAFVDPALVERAQSLVLAGEFDLRETKSILLVQIAAPETRASAWSFIRTHTDDILKALRDDEASWFIAATIEPFCEKTLIEEARTLFTERAARIEGAVYTLDQSLDTATQCVAAQARLAPSAAAFFRNR